MILLKSILLIHIISIHVLSSNELLQVFFSQTTLNFLNLIKNNININENHENRHLTIINQPQQYFYYEYYIDNKCQSNYTISTGFITNTCIKLYDLNQIPVLSMLGICSDSKTIR